MLSGSGDAGVHRGLLPYHVYHTRSGCLYKDQNGLLCVVFFDEGVPQYSDDHRHETEIPSSSNAFALPVHHLLASEYGDAAAGAGNAKR